MPIVIKGLEPNENTENMQLLHKYLHSTVTKELSVEQLHTKDIPNTGPPALHMERAQSRDLWRAVT